MALGRKLGGPSPVFAGWQARFDSLIWQLNLAAVGRVTDRRHRAGLDSEVVSRPASDVSQASRASHAALKYSNAAVTKSEETMKQSFAHVAALALLAAGTLWMLRDAAAQRAARQGRTPQVQSIVRLLGVADLALSSSSRWLRHPSITEPGAPFADSPAILDNDPAGAMIGPPDEVLAADTNGPAGAAVLRAKRSAAL